MWGLSSFWAVQEFAPGPLHTRHGLRRATLCKQERAFFCATAPVLLSLPPLCRGSQRHAVRFYRPTSGHPQGWPPSPQGEGFFASPFLRMKFSGRGMPPPLQCHAVRYSGSQRLHPLSQSFGLTAPPTQGNQRHAVRFYRPTSGHPQGWPPSPQGEGFFASPFLRMKFGGRGMPPPLQSLAGRFSSKFRPFSHKKGKKNPRKHFCFREFYT